VCLRRQRVVELRISSIPQKRFTAVGRVSASVFAMTATSAVSSSSVAACCARCPAHPHRRRHTDGRAPRTIISRMTSRPAYSRSQAHTSPPAGVGLIEKIDAFGQPFKSRNHLPISLLGVEHQMRLADVFGGEDAEEWQVFVGGTSASARSMMSAHPARGPPGRALRRRSFQPRAPPRSRCGGPPVVHTSSTMTTCAPDCRYLRCAARAVRLLRLRTRKPWIRVGAGSNLPRPTQFAR